MANRMTTHFSARKRLIATAISACFVSAPAWGNPSAPQVVNGSASFNQAGKLLTVSNSNGAIINWNTFSIGAGETTRFNQTSASSSVLNRVLANDPSVLLGTLSSNGRVWLVNPTGIMVGQGARIDVAGFIASTLNVRNEDFLAGRLNFGATPNAGRIENRGQISTPSGGSVYLVAPAVENHGIINAPNGEVILAAGQTVQLVDTGTPGVKVDITGTEGKATNLGEIIADAGRIGMAGVLVKNSGTLNASSVVRDGGRIFLKASQDAIAGGTISANSETGVGGRIEVAAAAVSISGGAVLDASGETRGGTILVGGGYQGKDATIANATSATIEDSASLKANAIGSGDGGLIVAWSDGATRAHGSFSARGGESGGRGGLVETSGKQSLNVAGARVDTRAADGSAGTWLLDPADITIVNGSASASGSPDYAPTGSASSITDGDINKSLETTNVSITTSSGSGGSGNITMNGNADAGGYAYIFTSGSAARTLTLNADGNIDIHGGASIYGTTSAPLTLNLYAGAGITNAGNISSYGSATFLSKGAIKFGDGSYSGSVYSYGSPVVMLANWDGVSTSAPVIDASGQCGASSFCGINGSGYIDSFSYSSSTVNAGAVTVKAPGDVDLSGINIYARGGNGYNYGSAGGAGGAVSIASTMGNLSTGSMDASGGAANSGTYGSSSVVNGGSGGAGGAGGTVNLSAAGTLTLGGTTRVNGGTGGQGGSGYYTWDSATSSYVYSGTGGNGGAGGNAGTISASGTSLHLSAATLNAYGGAGGTGGPGSSAGAAGANGTASPVTLATAGDIAVTGYNYVDASQVNLLAGKNIVFGTTGTSPTNGYLYSNHNYGSPLTLVANWNGSTSAPDIAASGQCTDGSFCGISGSGAIDNNYYYYSSNGNAAAVTLKAPGDIDLSSIAIYARGDGGYSYGSNGGAGGAVSVTSTQGNLSTGQIDASGGSGYSGSYASSSVVDGGAAGVGGAGGTVSLSAAGALTLGGTISVSGAYGGYGGSGYSVWDSGTSTYTYSGTGGNGGAGGNAGTISASGASLLMSGATLNARGGSGGTGGQGTSVGLAGGGGKGGNVTLTAITGDLGSGSIDASGGSGGSGASGVNGAVNGGSGGAGGVGGTVSLSAPAALTLKGTTSVAGGQAGGGAWAYSTYDNGTSSYVYSGSGGNGGAGGDAGTLSVSGAALVLSGATLNAYGGVGGSGGQGTAAGIAGARGSASPITLATAGDIGVTGYNYVDASELNLLSGKSITFGTAGASSANGYLNSNGSPISLLANWDGVSATAPAVAASGQCTDSSFCGISGSGSIDSNYYYYYYGTHANAGAVTLKAPGDIDLSNIAIYARGNSGYNYGDIGGAGGTVSIASTKGNLTTGYIDASGGSGDTGFYGTSSGVNGGTGGAGGAGGAINLSAPGTLTFGGTAYVSGGHGGQGGSGYYTWDSATSSYVYSGTGGTGGAGGNAGSINASGASLVLTGATLNARGGSSGSGGQGTTAGLAEGGGTGGNIIVTATTGDLTTGYIDVTGGSGGGGAYGVSGGVNAGAGGVGGAGGTVSLSAPGTLTLSGTTGMAGGQGGAGGSGYSTYDSGTSSYVYSGTGGDGGAGGNAGTLSVYGASLVLSGATLNAFGGSGGTGGQGTTAGSTGARGSASPITLSTAGDIGVTGSNYVDASELNLLSGKSIAFGTTGASPTSGYLSSNGSPITLLANWDGVSTMAPAIAAGGQCTDSSFCGISGSGSIDSNYYYYYYNSSLANAGAVTFKAPGDIDLTNIDIYARGSSGYNYGDAGGAGGVVSIASSKGNLTTSHIDAGGGGGASGSYGTSTVVDGGTGGAGGAGGTVNLSAASTLTLGGTTGVRGGNGGYGGSGYNTWDSGTSTYVYSGTGGSGGSGGSAGTINASGASLVLSNATLNAHGGSGGSGGYYGTSAGSAGARGTASPVTLSTSGDIAVTGSNYVNSNQFNLLAGGSISFGTSGASPTSGYLYSSYGSPVTLVANWNGSTAAPDAAGTAQCGTVFCGIGGTGGISSNYYYYYEDESQSKDGGALTLRAAGPVDLASINVTSNGAGGGNYYAGTREAGRGGAVTISSTQSDLSLGHVSALGGYGRSGTSGTATDPNGGAAGAGGTGGSIHASAAGSLLLGGNIDASGGAGGTGGAGYYDSSLASPAYTGAGGAGGAGGNAGSITLSGASITLDNANVRVLGGYPGLGSSNGTVAGAQGAAGAGNALQLATAGDITVLGYNNLAGNPIAMLAGKAITLGSSASGSGGHINSTGSDTLLVANWNGSTDTPEVAGTAQCAALFCGISGIGSISNGYDYYEGYYYSGQLQNQNGGTITLKAAGPVDLQSIIVNSIGGAGGTYYYTGMQAAGSGGTVAISSTQSDVILGYVSVAGGSGQHGASGTLTDPNGGAGGAGGAGGSVHAGAAGALTLSGNINAAGGVGGQGGSSYYDSGLATPAYTGTGGQGGAGGNAGSMSLSGAAVILGAMLDANGGAGGSGGQGATAGLAGAVGTGGNITLGATGGNLTLDSGAALSATAAGDALVLAAAGNFVNNAGASALHAPNGRWLVYSSNPASDVRGDLPYAFKHYGLAYTGSAYAGPGIGNGFVYSVVPSLSTDLTGTASKTYDGTTTGSLVLSNFSGVIDGDNVVLSGPASGVFADKNVGSGKSFSATVTLAGATNGATAVYGSAIASGNIGEIIPAPLTVSSPTVTKTYDGTTSVPGNFVASVGALAGAAGGGDTVATPASLAYADKNAGTGNKIVNASGLAIKDSLGADMTGNYAITYAPDAASTITPKAVTLSAPAVTKTYDGTTAYTAQTADLTALASPLVGGDTVSAAMIAYANKNAGAGTKVVTLDAATINDGNNGANYSLTLAGNSASTIDPLQLSVALTGLNKVYDGLTTATVSGGSLPGVIAGDAVAVSGIGTFADKNVGTAKAVSVSGITLSGADAGNYTLNATTATTTADITVRPLSTWTGGASGNWSVAANWDALPDLSNVTAVSVPAGTTVTYDAAAGSTNLGSLTAAGLSITGGALTIANSLTVSSNFSHSAGTLGFGSNASASITQATGDLTVRNLAAQNVSLTAQSGGVSQSGPIVASSLVTKSVTGTNLSDPGNQVSSFTATNSGSGNIVLTNKGALSVAGIANSGGNITLNNSGAITAAGALSAGGDISVVADALSLASGSSIDSGRDATLDAGVGDLVATKAAVSAARDIRAQVAGDLKLNDGSSFTAGNDIWLTLTGANSTLYLNELAGMQPSYFWAKAPSTIHLDFTARTSGGLVMDGAAMSALSYQSNVGGSGMFFGPARETAGVGHGFEVTGISPPAVVPTEVAAVIETVSSTITSTITSSTTAASTVVASSTPKVEAPPPPAPVATFGSSGPLLLTSTTQTIGGTPGSFGGSPTAPSAPTPSAPAAAASTTVTSGTAASGDKPAADKPVADKPAGAKPEDDKSASAKKDDSKAEEKKEEKKEDKKKDEEGGQKKQADKPAAKKLATCS